jgi:alpha-galactosidase
VERKVWFINMKKGFDNTLVLTPPMGWNSWNKFKGNINEDIIKEIADAMVSSGMKDAGYIYLNLDDNWMENPARGSNGNLIPDQKRFPNGIKALADYVHDKGLKLGIYGDRGLRTCMNISESGSYENEQRDANTFASWGIDYLKYDNCHLPSNENMQTDYTRMSNALKKCGRSIVFSICSWEFQPWMPDVGNLWRTTKDIKANWRSICSIIDKNGRLAQYAGPGHWNDPDMLEVGNGNLTYEQNKAHFSMWAMMAAPLIAGNDVRNMLPEIKEILLNSEVIAVDQDPLGRQGIKVVDNGSQEVWKKDCSNDGKIVCLLNRNTSKPANMTVNWNDIGITGIVNVRDLWSHSDKGTFKRSYSGNVPAGGCMMIRISK